MDRVMRKLSYIFLLLGLAGCSLDCNIGSSPNQDHDGGQDKPGDHDGGQDKPGAPGGDTGDGPTQGIKRRPIVPTDKLKRPRIIVRYDIITKALSLDCKAMGEMEIRCEATGYECSMNISPEDREIIIPGDELRGEVIITTIVDSEMVIESIVLPEE